MSLCKRLLVCSQGPLLCRVRKAEMLQQCVQCRCSSAWLASALGETAVLAVPGAASLGLSSAQETADTQRQGFYIMWLVVLVCIFFSPRRLISVAVHCFLL